jgi:hypothetical protein
MMAVLLGSSGMSLLLVSIRLLLVLMILCRRVGFGFLARGSDINIVDKIEGAPPGSVELRYVEGILMGVAYTCPGCGVEDWIPTDVGGWNVVSVEPLSLSPSVLHKRCGWHGFIRNGKWEVC